MRSLDAVSNSKRFLYSKTGVKVYLKPEYHPILEGTNLSHPDIVRKGEECFGKRYGTVEGLPKVCSENSEDALTWRFFSPLISLSPKKKGDWLATFLELSLGHSINEGLVRALMKAELMFWRGRKEEPKYSPPPSLGFPEGNTEVDLTIVAEETVIFVEAKHRSDIETHTTYCPDRDQIIRNIDVGTYYAWNRELDFYFVLLTSPNCLKSMRRLKKYQSTPQNIVEGLPHRTDIPNRSVQIANNLGLTTWNACTEVLSERDAHL